jgi:hypothetical protein
MRRCSCLSYFPRFLFASNSTRRLVNGVKMLLEACEV